MPPKKTTVIRPRADNAFSWNGLLKEFREYNAPAARGIRASPTIRPRKPGPRPAAKPRAHPYRTNTNWIAYVKAYRSKHPGMSYRDALKGASALYNKK